MSGIWRALPIALLLFGGCADESISGWTPREIALLHAFRQKPKVNVSPDLSGFAADERVIQLGKTLFFDTNFSKSGQISCASCHDPEVAFSDGFPTPNVGSGGSRNTPTVVGAAESPWQFWDGRKDSLWSQALAPIEAAAEHDFSRTDLVKVIAKVYSETFEKTFGIDASVFLDDVRFPRGAGPMADPLYESLWRSMVDEDRELVDRCFAFFGKAIEAYVVSLKWTRSRFDEFVDRLLGRRNDFAFTDAEAAGLHLFLGKANCVSCHFGPSLSNHDFHATGLPETSDVSDFGRAGVFRVLLTDPFNCQGRFSGRNADDCEDLKYINPDFALFYKAYKTPSLRGVVRTAPYMHNGSVPTLRAVIEHYNTPSAVPDPGHLDVQPLGLSEVEMRQLFAFLLTLDHKVDPGI